MAELGQNPNSFGFFVACTLKVSIGSIVDQNLSKFKAAMQILRELKRFENLEDQEKAMELEKQNAQHKLDQEID